jgi:hypothetical protein
MVVSGYWGVVCCSDASALTINQQSSEVLPSLGNLIRRALLRRFVGPPAEEGRSMAKAAAAKVVVLDLDHEPRL